MQCNTARAAAPLGAPALALALAALAAALAPGCAADRWGRPDPLREPLAAIADVFRYASAQHPDWPRPEDAAVVTVTAERVVWRPLEPPGEPARALRFADVTAVAFHEESPARGTPPEAIFLYVRGDPAVVAAAGARWQLPGEVSVPLARPFVSLRRRAPGSFARLLEALAALGHRPERG